MLLYLNDHDKTRVNPNAIATIHKGAYGTRALEGTGIDGAALYVNGDNRLLYLGDEDAAIKARDADLARIEKAMAG